VGLEWDGGGNSSIFQIKIEALDRHNSYLYYLPRLLTLVKYRKKVGLQKFAATSMNWGTYQFELVKKIHLDLSKFRRAILSSFPVFTMQLILT
jgi:hypothetical protein